MCGSHTDVYRGNTFVFVLQNELEPKGKKKLPTLIHHDGKTNTVSGAEDINY